ncbi:nucleoside triphosphate pyrophosphohydrolase family protein [Parvibaculum sp.]|uniref:nucleoside triphosphate pyrophosphohydrolase family protein n=1 Tax=Parvibaculum sp. TaxID=2024848 RepID=UPI0025D686D5|nr:nucleoside triphosphate pyrophosphohydrolase family protein [Parvibaculum sp.]
MREYQSLARRTDRTAKAGAMNLDFPLLGLFGEVGSLMSELKKKQRDADSYVGYEPSVVEELGDVLWYFSVLASRAQIALPDIARKVTHGLGNPDQTSDEDADILFASLQPEMSQDGPKRSEAFERALMKLAGEVGHIAAEFSAGRISDNRDALSGDLVGIFRSLIEVANEADVSLAEAAHGNLLKIFDRWPSEKTYPPLFDEGYDREEQLPRYIEMEMFEKTVGGKTYVFQRCSGINMGDRLTDNKLEEDDYRFHDVFHLAYAAKLGWSPVLRSLFRLKRKSNPKIDEAEDGARAALIEEGISTWIFNHASRLNFFENLSSVDYGLLKAVRELVSGYEAERCPLWLWEEAILDGYEIFRKLREHRRGIIIADLNERTITYRELPV